MTFDKSSAQISTLVFKTWLSRYTCCWYFIYDNGSEFKLHFCALCNTYGIKKKPTSVKNPQVNAILALSSSVNLETARQERSMLLADDKRLLREGNEVDLLCNQKWNYEQLKLILIRLEWRCILPGPPKRCTWNLMCLVCPILNAYAGMQSCIEVMMWCWGGRPATS